MAILHNQNVGRDWTAPAAALYASTVARPTTEGAQLILDMANELGPITDKSKILDVGAGTGAVTLTIAAQHPCSSILATDLSQKMMEPLTAKLATMAGDGSNVTLGSLDANKIEQAYDPSTFTHLFCNFVLQAGTTEPLQVVRQMYAVLQPGGVVGIAIWGPSPDVYKIWERACRAVDPDFTTGDQYGDPAAWRTPADLAANMQKAGFKDIKTLFHRTPFVWPSGTAYADFWLSGKNPGVQMVIDKWNRDSEAVGRDPTVVRDVLVDIVDKEWNGGAGLILEFVLGVGRK